MMETDEQFLEHLGRSIQDRIGGRVAMSVADAERVIVIATRATTAETALAEKEAELAEKKDKLERAECEWHNFKVILTSEALRDAAEPMPLRQRMKRARMREADAKAELAGVKLERDRLIRGLLDEGRVDTLNRIMLATPPAVETPGATGVCYCSDFQSSGVPCPPGKCPNATKRSPPVPEVVGAKCPECALPDEYLAALALPDGDGPTTGHPTTSPADIHLPTTRLVADAKVDLVPTDLLAFAEGGGKLTPPSAPVGRSEDEDGAQPFVDAYFRCDKPGELLIREAFAAGSASSVDRERVRECAEFLAKFGGYIDKLLANYADRYGAGYLTLEAFRKLRGQQ